MRIKLKDCILCGFRVGDFHRSPELTSIVYGELCYNYRSSTLTLPIFHWNVN